MKKIITLILLFSLCVVNVSYANYNGYKSYLKGLLTFKKGDVKIAISEYEKTLSYDPQATTVYKDLLIIYLQQGDTKKTLEFAKKLQEAESDNVRTQMFLSSVYLSINEMTLAKQCWEKVLEIDPKNELATVYLASYYYSDNKLKESIDYWTKFLEQQPESAEGYFQLGLTQEKLGMFDEALQSYKKVNEIKSEAQEGYLARARIYENKKDFKLAIKEYKEYAKMFSSNPSILLYLGKCYFEEGNYKDAEEIVLRAKEKMTNDIMLNYLLGMIYEKQNKIDDAIDVFENIIKIEPSASNYTRLGYYYAIKQNFKTAEQQFNKALELEPLNYEILYLSGLNYIDYKKFEKAKISLEKSLELKPDFTDAKFYLALVLDKLGHFEKTEEILKEILVQEPTNVKALNYLGYSYADKNINFEKAEQMLTKVIELEPSIPAYLDSLGWLYYKKKNYDLAEKYIYKAITSTPRVFDKDVYEHLGDVSIELNKLSQAYLTYAIANDLGSKTAISKMKLLENKVNQNEKFKIYAERAVFNFHRIASLKAGYKLKIKNNNTNINSYISVLYARGIGLQFDLAPQFSFQGGTVAIKNGNVTFEPLALKENISEDFFSIFDLGKQIISKDFFSTLLKSKISQKGNIVTYESNDFIAKINIKKGCFVEFSKKNVFSMKIKAYKEFNNISKIPSKILFTTENYNFKCEANLNKAQILSVTDISKMSGQKNNDNTNSSKN